MKVAQLIVRHPQPWELATNHLFLKGIRDGTLPGEAFTIWLAQDYLYLNDLLAFQARLLAQAPRTSQALLIYGLSGLEAELGWFEAHAERMKLSLNPLKLPATTRYAEWLEMLNRAPYPVGIAALWTLERVYLDAWRYAAPGQGEYREFVEHWTDPAFVVYVSGLEQAANLGLASGAL